MLIKVHPYMQEFFYWAKINHINLHIAQAWRGQEDQDRDFALGRSKLQWPHSKHNHLEKGVPCSLALDLFLIEDDGKAYFDSKFYEILYNEAVNADLAIRWGGTFKTLKDYDHFELKETKNATSSGKV